MELIPGANGVSSMITNGKTHTSCISWYQTLPAQVRLLDHMLISCLLWRKARAAKGRRNNNDRAQLRDVKTPRDTMLD
jgi:hypothetical protein